MLSCVMLIIVKPTVMSAFNVINDSLRFPREPPPPSFFCVEGRHPGESGNAEIDIGHLGQYRLGSDAATRAL